LEGNAEVSQKRTALKKKRAQLIEFSMVLEQLQHGNSDDDDTDETVEAMRSEDYGEGDNNTSQPSSCRGTKTPAAAVDDDAIEVQGNGDQMIELL